MSPTVAGNATSPDHTTLATRDEMIEQNRPLVITIAVRMMEQLPSQFSFADAVTAGLEGLNDAVASFDAQVHRSFGLYTRNRVRAAILDRASSSLVGAPEALIAA